MIQNSQVGHVDIWSLVHIHWSFQRHKLSLHVIK